MTTFILTCVVAVAVSVFLIVAIDAALEWFDRHGLDDCDDCRAAGCAHIEPPSRLDRLDGVDQRIARGSVNVTESSEQ